MEVVEISDNDKKQIMEVFNRIPVVHGLIGDAKIAKRLLTRTHLISVVPAIWKSIERGLSDKQVKSGLQLSFLEASRPVLVQYITRMQVQDLQGRKQ